MKAHERLTFSFQQPGGVSVYFAEGKVTSQTISTGVSFHHITEPQTPIHSIISPNIYNSISCLESGEINHGETQSAIAQRIM